MRISLTLCASLLSVVAHASEPAKEAHGAHDGAGSEEFASRVAKQSSRDVKVPRSLVARIENEYREFLKVQQVPESKGLIRKLLNVTVEMSQKRPAALHENVRINTPLGGGVIDLAEFTTPVRGSFSTRIRGHLDDGHDIPGLRVFFVSKAKSREVGGEQFGAGCDKFMEITSLYTQKQSGFELYTADQRYVSVLGGTFVLVAFAKEALQVGSVSFYDSRFPDLMCE